MECVIITGLSGAGRSTVLKAFEDMDFFCVDNLPPVMATTFVKTCRDEAGIQRVAMVMDTRAGVFFDKIYDAVAELRASGIPCRILFLDTADDILIRRYKEVRRPHPMHPTNIAEGIAIERKRLARIREMADNVMDSTNLTMHQLMSAVTELYSQAGDNKTVPIIVSFGYKNGIPMDADMVFDVRFLPNPYYVEDLRPHSGLTGPVQQYVFAKPYAKDFLNKVYGLLSELMPYYAAEGKRQIVLAIGCTGGMHRSVAMAAALHQRFLDAGYNAVVIHRDIQKDAYLKAN